MFLLNDIEINLQGRLDNLPAATAHAGGASSPANLGAIICTVAMRTAVKS